MKKKLQRALWAIGFLLLHFSSLAQETTVTGRVTSVSDNSSLPGVSVTIKGRSTGTVTDSDGVFKLNVSPSDVLVFSFIGMETQEIEVGNQQDIQISLTESIQSLQEVVVVGYGSQKKTNLTGAVAS